MLVAPRQSASRHPGHSRAHRRVGGTDRSRRAKVNRQRHQLCSSLVSPGNCREKRPPSCQVAPWSSQDILGRLVSVTEDATPSDGTDDPQTDTGYSYDLLGRKRAQLTIAPGDTVPNSVETSYLYDSLGRLDVMTNTDGNGNTLASYDYEVRPDGKRTTSTETFWFDENSDGQLTANELKANSYSWTYDDAGRLTDEVIDHWDDAFDQTESFTYDLTGNRKQLDRDKGNDGTIDEAITYTYDANDRLLDEVLDSIVDADDTTTTYIYDQTHQTSKTVTSDQLPVSSQSFTYNLQGRMASVTNESYDASGTLTSRDRTGYEYDSKSYRVKLTNETDTVLDGNFIPDSTTEFLASHRNKTGYAQTLRETKFDADGNLTKQIDYTFGDDEISQRTREFDAVGNVTSDQTLVFGHDGHGSVRVLYDLTGAATKIIQAFTFSAYGEMIALHNAAAQSVAISGRLSSTGYSGETFDSASQQQYLRARFYNPANGRFNRLDDFAGNNSDPQSLHKYAYVHGDPIGGVDPTGESAIFWLFLAAIATVAVVGASIHQASPYVEGFESSLEKATAVGWGGKDITSEMRRLTFQMRKNWASVANADKEDIIQTTSRVFYGDHELSNPFGMNPKALDSWDVKELASLSEQHAFKARTPDNWIPRSVTVENNVHLAHEVNYFFYGYLHGLAWAEHSDNALDLAGLKNRIHLYRPAGHLFFNIREQRKFDGSAVGRIAWAQAGWKSAVREQFITPGRAHSIPRGIPSFDRFGSALHFRAVGLDSGFHISSRPLSVSN